jgi:hypothetical protein
MYVAGHSNKRAGGLACGLLPAAVHAMSAIVASGHALGPATASTLQRHAMQRARNVCRSHNCFVGAVSAAASLFCSLPLHSAAIVSMGGQPGAPLSKPGGTSIAKKWYLRNIPGKNPNVLSILNQIAGKYQTTSNNKQPPLRCSRRMPFCVVIAYARPPASPYREPVRAGHVMGELWPWRRPVAAGSQDPAVKVRSA